MPTDRLASLNYSADNGLACKVVLPSDPCISDIDIQYMRPDFNKNLKILEEWGKEDGNIMVNL